MSSAQAGNCERPVSPMPMASRLHLGDLRPAPTTMILGAIMTYCARKWEMGLMKIADEQSGMQRERVCLEIRIGTHVNEYLAASVYGNLWACRATSAQRSGLWTGFCFRMTTLMYTFCQPRSQGQSYRPLRRSSSISGSHVKAIFSRQRGNTSFQLDHGCHEEAPLLSQACQCSKHGLGVAGVRF